MAFQLPKLAQVMAWLESLSPEQVCYLLAALALPLAISLFIVATILTIILRILGLSHPHHYQYWPRLPWRLVYRVWMGFTIWFEQVFRFGKHRTGSFAGWLVAFCLVHKVKTVFLGRAMIAGFGTMQPVGVPVSRHIMVFAMTGGGKTTWLITMVHNWDGSVFILDPKGQVTYALARCDKKRTWVILDPYNPSDQWNPFDTLKAAIELGEDPVKWAMRISESLIVTPTGSKTPYFTDTSRGFVTSLILHILTFFDEQYHNLGFMRELIIFGLRVVNDDGSIETSPEEARALLYQTMRENTAFQGAVAGGAAAFESASGETEGNLLSTLQEQTKWLDIPSVRHMLADTTKPLSDLKTRDDVVMAFVCPVLSFREELKPLARLLTNMVAYTFESVKKSKGDCLYIVDELQAMGHNPALEVILPVARSYKLLAVCITQDVEGTKSAFPDTYQAFSGNADIVLYMGSNHPSNIDQLSKILGQKSHIERDPYTGKKTYRDVDVTDAEQVARLLDPERGNVIVTRAGKRPLLLKQDPYYKALPVWAYDPDPDHREPILRAVMRFILNRKPK